jgi:hypothetical protein
MGLYDETTLLAHVVSLLWLTFKVQGRKKDLLLILALTHPRISLTYYIITDLGQNCMFTVDVLGG